MTTITPQDLTRQPHHPARRSIVSFFVGAAMATAVALGVSFAADGSAVSHPANPAAEQHPGATSAAPASSMPSQPTPNVQCPVVRGAC
jgi:hypothetical protein